MMSENKVTLSEGESVSLGALLHDLSQLESIQIPLRVPSPRFEFVRVHSSGIKGQSAILLKLVICAMYQPNLSSSKGSTRSTGIALMCSLFCLASARRGVEYRSLDA